MMMMMMVTDDIMSVVNKHAYYLRYARYTKIFCIMMVDNTRGNSTKCKDTEEDRRCIHTHIIQLIVYSAVNLGNSQFINTADIMQSYHLNDETGANGVIITL